MLIKSITTIFISVLLSSFFYSSYAAQNPGGAETAGGVSLENPSLSQMGVIIGRIFNTALYAAGAALVAMIAHGVWKSAMAVGDPRALEGAKQTWTYALYGFFVIVLFFVLFMIITGWFGITSLPNPGMFITNMFSAIEELVSVPTK